MIIQGKEFPDRCPEKCLHIDDINNYGQSAICRFCPVFLCQLIPADPSVGVNAPFRMLEPKDVHHDLVNEWHEFFVTNKLLPENEDKK